MLISFIVCISDIFNFTASGQGQYEIEIGNLAIRASSFILLGLVVLVCGILEKLNDKLKSKQDQIEMKDERCIAIKNVAGANAFYISMFLLFITICSLLLMRLISLLAFVLLLTLYLVCYIIYYCFCSYHRRHMWIWWCWFDALTTKNACYVSLVCLYKMCINYTQSLYNDVKFKVNQLCNIECIIIVFSFQFKA